MLLVAPTCNMLPYQTFAIANQGVSRTKKLLKKEELVKEFDGKFSIEILEKVFHGLRASYLREHKKYKDGNLPKQTWKFYETMLFLSENGPMQKAVFTTEERDFYNILQS